MNDGFAVVGSTDALKAEISKLFDVVQIKELNVFAETDIHYCVMVKALVKGTRNIKSMIKMKVKS